MSVPVAARTLAEITAAARLSPCPCGAVPECPCEGGGTHLSRYERARRNGLLSRADMTAVVAAVIASEVPAIVRSAA